MTPDPRCDQTFFCVEANSNEIHHIWRELCERGVHWRQDSGIIEKIGHIKIGNENLSVCVCLSWNWIRGKLICFYDAISRVVDHQMIEDYLKANVIKDKTWDGGRRIIKTNATNYHMMWQAIEESQVLWNDVLKQKPFSFKNLNDLAEALWNRGVRQLPSRKAGEIFWGPTEECKHECELTPTEIKWLNQRLDLLALNTVST
jgi:hypothetical protein